jgi:hypothetical protein
MELGSKMIITSMEKIEVQNGYTDEIYYMRVKRPNSKILYESCD